MLTDVVDDLACAVCGADTTLAGGAVRCRAGHSFDVARQGYVSMLAGHRGASGDAPEMVAARDRFLSGGNFGPVRDAVVAAATQVRAEGCVVDVGAGTGDYLAAVLDALPERRGIALDASTAASRRAARCHPRAGAVACDAWERLPVRTGAAAVVLNVFAPRNGAEMSRVLAPGGALVVATPTQRHLHELVERLGLLRVDESKAQRVEDALGPWFGESGSVLVEHAMQLGPADVADVVAMGPSAHHVAPPEGLPDELDVTCSVKVTTFVASP